MHIPLSDAQKLRYFHVVVLLNIPSFIHIKQTDRQAYREKRYKQTCIQTDRQAGRYAGRYAGRQAGIQTDRHTVLVLIDHLF